VTQDQELEAAADLFKALANPVRLGILRALIPGPQCVHELSDATGASQPLVSQHLRHLRQVRLVTSSRKGRETEYRLADEHVGHVLNDAINHVKES
jgi:ArsR family transcriptional regulator, zinc-responsive transcriptional repressor